jgi:hypothetical protein
MQATQDFSHYEVTPQNSLGKKARGISPPLYRLPGRNSGRIDAHRTCCYTLKGAAQQQRYAIAGDAT